MDDLQQVLVIVDVTRLGELQSGPLADYVAMVGLAQIDPEAPTGAFDTVLNLFDPAVPPVQGLTDFDWAYLRGLYAAERTTATPRGRAVEVAVEMEQRLRERP